VFLMGFENGDLNLPRLSESQQGSQLELPCCILIRAAATRTLPTG
jgi:hypothetical protein